MFAFLLKGILLGATAAAQPGPFQAYLLSQVTQRGWRRTLPASLAPLISDGPIVALMLFVLAEVPKSFLAWIQIAGGVFILYLAFSAFRAMRSQKTQATAADNDSTVGGGNRQSIWRASLMNLLNPNPYIFWASVGGPIVVSGWRISPGHAIAFMVGMYALLVGGLALFVVIFGKLGALSSRANTWLNGVSAAALFLFGAWQLWSGITPLAG